jgi:hypothetical protein
MQLGKEHTGRKSMLVVSAVSLPGRIFTYLKFEGFEDSGAGCMIRGFLDLGPVKFL